MAGMCINCACDSAASTQTLPVSRHGIALHQGMALAVCLMVLALASFPAFAADSAATIAVSGTVSFTNDGSITRVTPILLESGGQSLIPLIMAGSAGGSPPDSPAAHVDPNVATSPFGGVVSIQVVFGTSTYIGSGTVIAPNKILTAAHVVDINADGVVDIPNGSLTIWSNLSGNLDQFRNASAIVTHPDWTGFNNPSVNDDLAIITLTSPFSPVLPIYPIEFGSLGGGFGPLSQVQTG